MTSFAIRSPHGYRGVVVDKGYALALTIRRFNNRNEAFLASVALHRIIEDQRLPALLRPQAG